MRRSSSTVKTTAYLGFKVFRFVLAFIGLQFWLIEFGISVAIHLLLTDDRKSSFFYPTYEISTFSPKPEASHLSL